MKKILFAILTVFAITFSMSTSLNAETIDVGGQDDCPGGNDGWRRDVEHNVSTGVVVTHCTRIEIIVATPEPTPTPTASPEPTPGTTSDPAPSAAPTPAPTPLTVSRVVGTDPYPGIVTGGEIPGTRSWSTDETSWNQFYEKTIRDGWRCPSIYGPNGDPFAAENNGLDAASGKYFRVCVKNPWREPVNPYTQQAYDKQKSDAQALALSQSQQWNSDNPGEQKCFQWGPLISPSGGTESGGVCANPIGVKSSATSETTTALSQSDTQTIESPTNLAPITQASQETVTAILQGVTNESATVGLSKNTVPVIGSIDVKSISRKTTVLIVNLDSERLNITIIATKKGSATLRLQTVTNSAGDKTIKYARSLIGYLVSVQVEGKTIDKIRI
jgi:hypothetical protein